MSFYRIRLQKIVSSGTIFEESTLKVGWLTDPGKQREINEDSLYVDENLGLFIVADGMGGHNAGEVASRMAVEVTAKSVREGLEAGKEADRVVREAIAQANRSIFENALNNPAWEEMGTTLLIALAVPPQVDYRPCGRQPGLLHTKRRNKAAHRR